MIREAFASQFNNSDYKFDEPMAKHTTFKVGGPADIFINSKCSEVSDLIAFAKNHGISYEIIGNGSNLLVSDDGYRGLVICLAENASNIEVMDDTPHTDISLLAGEMKAIDLPSDVGIIRAEAGALLSKISHMALEHSLEGLEFASGIPGSFGGGIIMNAGAYGSELKDFLSAVVTVDDDGIKKVYLKGEYELGYRHSSFMESDDIVLEALLVVPKGDKERISEKIKDLRRQRQEKQPLEFPSAGSTFKRPEGRFAGKLIMDAGLKGFSIGGAQVSEKHAGFVVNKGNATADDIYRLIKSVSKQVLEKFGVVLEPEVRFMGVFKE